MKHRKKGRKIYTYQAKNRRIFSPYHPVRNAVGTGITLILTTLLGVVGYNIIGPVTDRLRAEEITPTTTPEPYFTEVAPETTAPPEQTQTQTASVTTVTTQKTTAKTTAATTVTTEYIVNSKYPADATVAYYVPEDALKDLASLGAAAKKCAESGYPAMILPMKLPTGMLQYASSVDKARICGASNDSMLTLRDITNEAKRYHVKCIAEFSTLEDHVYPNYFMEGSYVFQDGNTRWLDNKPEEGGKPWLNPFDAAAAEYLAELAAELCGSGFDAVICKGTVFPHFFPSDAELIGNHVTEEAKRKVALDFVLNTIAAGAAGAGMYTDAHALLFGEEEAFDAQGLSMGTVFAKIDPSAFTEAFSVAEERYDPSALAFREKMLMITDALKKTVGGRLLVPCLSESELSADEIEQAIELFYNAGYKNIYILP